MTSGTNLKNYKELRQAAIAFIAMGLALSILNTVVGPRLDLVRAERLNFVYGLFQTVVRTAFVLYGGFLMLSFYNQSHGLRREGIGSLMIAAGVLVTMIPVMTGYYDFLYVLMPFPWSTYPLQLIYDGRFLAVDVSERFGGNGRSALLIIYFIWQILIYAAVSLRGRRQFCSMLCGHAAVHAETLSDVLPLVGTYKGGREGMSVNLKVMLATLKAFVLVVNLVLMLLWVSVLFGSRWINPELLRVFESVKLMSLDFVLFYIGMIFLNGRAYCFYCPSGTALSFWGLVFNHGLETHHEVCVACGQCNASCELGINVMARAKKGKKLQSSHCVGCGHCVDVCPTKTLKLVPGVTPALRAGVRAGVTPGVESAREKETEE
jgi:ferredoxin-type protein NapH